MFTLTGYEATTKSTIAHFDGNPAAWPRWRKRFELLVAELKLSEVLKGDDTDDAKQAQLYRILYLSCRDRAEDILNTQTQVQTGSIAWDLLCKQFDKKDDIHTSSLHQRLYTLDRPTDPSQTTKYSNNVLEIVDQLTIIDKKQRPTDEAVYGLIKSGLKGELLIFSDTLDLLQTTSAEIQAKARLLLPEEGSSQQAFSSSHQGPRPRGRGRGERGRGRGGQARRFDHQGQYSDSSRSSSSQQSNSRPNPASHNNNKGERDQYSRTNPQSTPRKIFKCPYHRTNGHSQSDCRAVKDLLAASKVDAQSPEPDDEFGYSATFTDTDDDCELNLSLSDLYELTQAHAATTKLTGFQVDSACTHHMVRDRDDFTTYVPHDCKVHLADGSTTRALGRGDVVTTWKDADGVSHYVTLKAIHVPELSIRLFSVVQAIDDGHQTGQCS
jgi:hypothetical protein